MSIESPAKIDLFRLEIECQDQDQSYKFIAQALAEAKKALAEEESQMEVVDAELGKDIRRNPAKYGLEKTTNDPVKEAITLTPEHRKQKQICIDRQYDVDLLTGYQRQMEHRKMGLEKAVEMMLAGFFSKPRPKETRLVVKRKTDNE